MNAMVPERSLRLRRGALAVVLALLAGGCATPAPGPRPGGRALRLAALPSDLATALQAHRAPLTDTFVGMFDKYLPPAVKQLGLQ